MSYTSEQIRNALTILRVAREVGADKKQVASALLAGWVESYGYKNVPAGKGDRDSVGVFQQRPSQGWGTVAELSNVETAARRYFLGVPQRGVPGALSINHAGLTPGQLAQKVQRSAFPLRYDQAAPQVEKFLRTITAGAGNVAIMPPATSPAAPVGSVSTVPSDYQPSDEFRNFIILGIALVLIVFAMTNYSK
jgi:hypothetical protein